MDESSEDSGERELRSTELRVTVQSGKSFLSMDMEDADGWPGPLSCNGHYRSFETMNVLLFYLFAPFCDASDCLL